MEWLVSGIFIFALHSLMPKFQRVQHFKDKFELCEGQNTLFFPLIGEHREGDGG